MGCVGSMNERKTSEDDESQSVTRIMKPKKRIKKKEKKTRKKSQRM
jgi:hypothetical protein